MYNSNTYSRTLLTELHVSLLTYRYLPKHSCSCISFPAQPCAFYMDLTAKANPIRAPRTTQHTSINTCIHPLSSPLLSSFPSTPPTSFFSPQIQQRHCHTNSCVSRPLKHSILPPHRFAFSVAQNQNQNEYAR